MTDTRSGGLKIVSDAHIPVGEVWLMEPAGFDVRIDGARVVLTRYDKIVGKIVGLHEQGDGTNEPS